MGLVRHCLQYKSKWSIGFECLHPVIFSLFRIHAICLIYECYWNISKKTNMTLNFKMFEQTFLHKWLILFIFPIIAFVIVPSRTEFISGFLYILLTTTLTCKEKNYHQLSSDSYHHSRAYGLFWNFHLCL